MAEFLRNILTNFLTESQADGVITLLAILFLVNFIIIIVAFMTLLERRLIGKMQNRIGPNRVGPNGLLQPFADVIKLFLKEDIVIPMADRWAFNIAPLLVLMPALAIWIVMPFGATWILADLDTSVLFIVAITGFGVIGVFTAGWASNNKFALIGAMRSIASLISYEVPMLLAVASVVLVAGSMSLRHIVVDQSIPFILVQPLGFVVMLLAVMAELNRSPFDIVEAESELISGYNTEYTGMKFGLFFLAEWMAALAWSGVIVTLFLSGWRIPFVQADLNPFIDGLIFLAKTVLVFTIFVWFRGTWPRLRIDQILGFSWKVLFPVATINLAITAIEVVVFFDMFNLEAGEAFPSGALLIMGIINTAIFFITATALTNLIRIREPETVTYPTAATTGGTR